MTAKIFYNNNTSIDLLLISIYKNVKPNLTSQY